MKIETESLSGAALDWAVASALNMQYREDRVIKIRRTYDEPTAPAWIEYENSVGSAPMYHRFTPSTSWDQAGPIIQRERISVISDFHEIEESWMAESYGSSCSSFGASPMKAAMRCYVMSRLGAEIEIPEGLQART